MLVQICFKRFIPAFTAILQTVIMITPKVYLASNTSHLRRMNLDTDLEHRHFALHFLGTEWKLITMGSEGTQQEKNCCHAKPTALTLCIYTHTPTLCLQAINKKYTWSNLFFS